MIKINLVAEAPTKAARTKRAQSEFSLGTRQGDILLVVVLALALLGIGTRWLLLKNERDHLREVERAKRVERDELQPYIQKVQELETKRDQLRHKIDVINNLKQNQRGPVRIMDEVSRALPDLVWLTRMTMKGNSLTISGTAMDETAVANYISNLDSSPFFQEPTLKRMARGKEDTFSFVLDCTFTYAPPEISGEDEAPGT
jgi:type IV pilus assembly protein PilN